MSVTWTTGSWTSASPQPKARLLKLCRNSIASSGSFSRCAAWLSQGTRPDLFDTTNPALRIARHLFDAAEGSLRADVDALREDGSGLLNQLWCETNVLGLIPIHDGVGEGLHARFARFRQDARRANFSFLAATCRLSQNLTDARTMLAPPGMSLQDVWASWQSILQVDHRHRQTHATVRCTDRVFQRKMYHMEWLVGNLHGPSKGTRMGEGEEGEGGGSGDFGATRYHKTIRCP